MVSQDRHGTVFHYWISFWPVAPFFGVNWRFEKMMPGAGYFRPGKVAAAMAKAGALEAARATSEAVEKLSAQVDAATHAAADAVSAQVEAAAVAMAAAAEAAAPGMAVEPPVVAFDAPAAADDLDEDPEVTLDAPLAEVPALLFVARPDDADDLKVLKGVGPKLEAMLNGMGVYTLKQIAGFSEANLAWVDANLTAFKGRPLRDGWVEQAKALI
jgi:hypothetical protein